MSKISKYILLFTFYFLLFTLISSCDKVEGPYVKETNTAQDTSNYKQNVLLEEFTASQCGNCPSAHKILEGLEEKYGSKLISYSIHSGYLAEPSGDFVTDFRTQTGNDIFNKFLTPSISFPTGMINRRIEDNQRIVNDGQWEEEIGEFLNMIPRLDIQMFDNYDIASQKLTSSVFIHTLDTISLPLMLSVYIVEDSIRDLQEDYNPSPHEVQNYLMRNVLRGSMNGTWGEDLKNKTLQKDQFISKSYIYTLNQNWNYHQVYTIAFVYNKNDYQVLQCRKTKISP